MWVKMGFEGFRHDGMTFDRCLKPSALERQQARHRVKNYTRSHNADSRQDHLLNKRKTAARKKRIILGKLPVRAIDS